jgi:tetratricopeptide (TPR) repeat protein
VDVLHPARRFWKPRDLQGGAGRPFQDRLNADPERVTVHREGCSLQALERQIVGMRRVGDVDGFEIPARYFQFVRSGDARPLAAVLEHNRLDLLTLAALTARLLHLTRGGPADVNDPREVLALGHVYARAGFDERARTAFRLAIERCRSPRRAYDPIRIEAWRLLALAWRRARRFDEAADCWAELLEIRGCPAPIEREATAALAIHHEHRRRDLHTAKAFALRSLESTPAPAAAWSEAVRHRLARIDRKLGASRTQLALGD